MPEAKGLGQVQAVAPRLHQEALAKAQKFGDARLAGLCQLVQELAHAVAFDVALVGDDHALR